MKEELVTELRNQKVPEDWIMWAIKRLKTKKQQQKMMEYLETTRNKVENFNKFVLKTIEIKKMKD